MSMYIYMYAKMEYPCIKALQSILSFITKEGCTNL